MADDNTVRSQRDPEYPQTRPAADGGRTRRGSEDPLAELARLIGQDDPFADFKGGARPRGRTPPLTSDAAEARKEERDPRDLRARTDTIDRRVLERTPRDRPTSGNGRGAYDYGATQQSGERSLRYPSRTIRADTALARREAEAPRPTRSLRPEPADAAFESSRSGAYDPEYSDDAHLPERSEDLIEQAPPKQRRTLKIVAAVAGIAVICTAGAFGYRAVFSPTPGKQPPVIGPQAGPNKVVPSTAATPTDGTKQIYDRIGGDPKANERVVPRTETPIDVAARTGQVPTQTPAPATTQNPPPIAAPAPSPVTSTAEPRRVRTVTVRADGSVVTDPTPRVTAPVPPPAPRPTTQTTPARPLAVNTYAPTSEETEEPRTPVSATAVTRPAPPPTAGPAWPPLQAQPARPTTTPQARVQIQPAASGYVVQVSSQRTEAEAEAAWRSLQARHPAVLASQQATIRRADVGGRGTFYRAQIGPFAAREQAAQLCDSLKAAGGECVVQRN